MPEIDLAPEFEEAGWDEIDLFIAYDSIEAILDDMDEQGYL